MCSANQLTGFYVNGILTLNGLSAKYFELIAQKFERKNVEETYLQVLISLTTLKNNNDNKKQIAKQTKTKTGFSGKYVTGDLLNLKQITNKPIDWIFLLCFFFPKYFPETVCQKSTWF